MKKGIVMEKHRQYTIIMTKEGTFHKAIPIEDAMIGAEVFYEPLESKNKALFLFSPRKMNVPVRILSMVCILLLFVLPFYFVMGKNNTYAYVNIDINPSIELEINDTLNVQSIRALNDDASMIVKQLVDYENVKLEKVIEIIMDKSEETGLINDSKNMLVGVSYTADKKDKLSVLDKLEQYFLNENTEWEIAAFNVPENVREKAKEINKSMNEVMATTIFEEEKSDEKNTTEHNSMNDEEKAIINSFYNTDKNHSKDKDARNKNIKIIPKKTDDHTKGNSSKKEAKSKKIQKDIPDSRKTKEKSHPRELKSKNGEVNSNGKNKSDKNHEKYKNSNKHKENGKDKVQKQKRHMQDSKYGKGKNKDKNKHKHKSNNGHSSKHKDFGKQKNNEKYKKNKDRSHH